MTDESPKEVAPSSDYLHAHGADLIDSGYTVIPIVPGEKFPPFDDWQKMRATRSVLNSWLNEGYGRMGVGINTTNTPAIDIDVEDEDVADRCEAWIRENIADAPVRFGKHPRRLMLFRATTPFTKVMSAKYLDEWQEQQKVEVLGDGQQFVAFHIHPDTRQPYRWKDSSPLNVEVGKLPILTPEKAREFVEWFTTVAEEEGWKLTGRAAMRKTGGKIDRDNPFVEDSTAIDTSPSELRELLMTVPGFDDYDTWFEIGMALYHQFDGDDTGLEMWNEWSEPSPKFDRQASKKKWKTFAVTGKGRAPTTARLILKLAKDAAETQAKKAEVDLRAAFAEAKDMGEWVKAQEDTQRAEINLVSRTIVIDAARKAFNRINGVALAMADARKMLSYRAEHEDAPKWLKSWAFDQVGEKFINVEKKYSLSITSFNVANVRNAISTSDKLAGMTTPSKPAFEVATAVYSVPMVNGVRYLPGDGTLVHDESGNLFVNKYSEAEIPELPGELSSFEQKCINRVVRHVAHLLPDPVEQGYLLDWLTYVIQNPGKRVNYALFLQGTEGDGKSFFASLLRAVMGGSNVRLMNAGILENPFTGWAEGQCVACLEEVRMLSHNRYDIINRIKPYITNDVAEVHPKGKEQYNVVNTTNYVMFSNFQDALPINENDRRYLILFSRWQSKAALMAFMAENPEYYDRLYAAIEKSAGAIRKFFLDRDLSDDFNPKAQAPVTMARQVMIHATRSDFVQALLQLIEENRYPDISRDLLNVATLRDVTQTMSIPMPEAKLLRGELNREGFHPLGQVRLGDDRAYFWSSSPDKYKNHEGRARPEVVKKFLDDRQQLLGSATSAWDEDDEL